ncbi:lipolytic enzyme [Asimina triloba]
MKKLTSISINLFLMMLFFLISFHSSSVVAFAAEPLSPAIFIFGDSLSDDGNNNGLPTAARANYPPYGVDFVNGITGRFTNGKNVVDYIAEFLGLPCPPPYLGLSPDKRSKIITGVNYASAAAGILPETGTRMGKNIQLSEQVDNFEKTVQQDLPQNFEFQKDVADYLSQSIFIVNIGMNDYGNNYLQPDFYNASKHYTPLQFAYLLVLRLSQQLKRLYDLGARKIVVFERLPLGCMPAATNVIDFFPICIEPVNEMVLQFNFQLYPMLRRLTVDLPRSTFVDGRVYAPAYYACHNPSKYGEDSLI